MELTERDYACVGPRNAKPTGSISWCWQTIDLLKIRWRRKDFTDQQFQEVIEELTAQHVWERIPPEAPYGSLEALLEAEIGCGEQEARSQLVTEVPERGRRKLSKLDNSTQSERAAFNGISRYQQNKIDYLAGHAPALLTQVQEGQMSIHRAYKEARGMPEMTPLDYLHRYWRQVSPDDRLRFLVEMLTPNERRALQLGLEEDESHA